MSIVFEVKISKVTFWKILINGDIKTDQDRGEIQVTDKMPGTEAIFNQFKENFQSARGPWVFPLTSGLASPYEMKFVLEKVKDVMPVLDYSVSNYPRKGEIPMPPLGAMH